MNPSPGAFQVTCVCGQVLAGSRQKVHQVFRCERCGAQRFILPSSPLPPLGPALASPSSRRPLTLRHWLLPALAALLTLGTLIFLYVVFLAPERRDPAGNQPEKSWEQRFHQAEQFLEEGSFRLAVLEMEGATPKTLQQMPKEK